MRRFGERVVPGQDYTTRPGAYAIIHDGTDILITEQLAPLREYQLAGGGIGQGENPHQALHREILEETGWRVTVDRRLGAFQRFCYMPEYDLWARKVCHVYVCRAVAATAEPTELHHRAVWAEPGVALNLLAGPGDRHWLRFWLSQQSRYQ